MTVCTSARPPAQPPGTISNARGERPSKHMAVPRAQHTMCTSRGAGGVGPRAAASPSLWAPVGPQLWGWTPASAAPNIFQSLRQPLHTWPAPPTTCGAEGGTSLAWGLGVREAESLVSRSDIQTLRSRGWHCWVCSRYPFNHRITILACASRKSLSGLSPPPPQACIYMEITEVP